MAILETKDLRKIYGSGENEVHALDGVSISVEEGEFVAVIGTSGSGKSTLLNMIGGLDRPTSGSVTIRGKELLKMKDEELTIFRRRNIGFVFQNYNLLPVLNVYENIVYPIEIDGGKTDTRFVKEIIHTLGLEQKLKNMPNNLSGGQQQRVAIARALATKPAIILADEPTGNLDSKTSMDVILLMQSISRQFHQTTIMITHNEEIAQMADRTIRIEDGKVVSGGSLNLNPNSLTIIKDAYVEPSFDGAKAYDSFQFVRNGYFCVDSHDSEPDHLVFNRIVSLKSSFKLPK